MSWPHCPPPTRCAPSCVLSSHWGGFHAFQPWKDLSRTTSGVGSQCRDRGQGGTVPKGLVWRGDIHAQAKAIGQV